MAQTPAAPSAPAAPKEEMWWVILAKSKTMRFFSVSCEFLLFLGCLWLTMTTILPQAIDWANGTIDTFFLVAMGFAVDAAMPEAWLHVVDQWTDQPRKVMPLRWSVGVAIAMSLLVIANVTYSKIAGTSGAQPTGAMEAVVNVLLIARILIGISYVAIRECQSFLDRKQARQQSALPAAPDIQALISWSLIALAATEEARMDTLIDELQTSVDHRLAEIAGDQGQLLVSVRQLQAVPTPPPIDPQEILAGVLDQLEPRFTSALKRLEGDMEQQIRVSVERSMPQAGPYGSVSHEPGGTALTGRRLVSLPPRSVPGGTMKRDIPATSAPVPTETADAKSIIYRLLDDDHARQVADIVQLTGLPKTTVWRHWNRYHEERGTRGLARVAGPVDPSSASETA